MAGTSRTTSSPSAGASCSLQSWCSLALDGPTWCVYGCSWHSCCPIGAHWHRLSYIIRICVCALICLRAALGILGCPAGGWSEGETLPWGQGEAHPPSCGAPARWVMGTTVSCAPPHWPPAHRLGAHSILPWPYKRAKKQSFDALCSLSISKRHMAIRCH
eukprot:1161482-Pelagomonas_calceolata.AAC.3